MRTKNDSFRFFAEHFWALYKKQNGCCALTGRKLTPDTTEVELRQPYKEKGRTDFDNHYLIIRSIAAMARYATEDDILDVAIEIVRHRGKERGYALKKLRG